MDANDLKDFCGISTSTIMQKPTIAYHSSFSLLKYHLEQMFGTLKETLDSEHVPTLTVYYYLVLLYLLRTELICFHLNLNIDIEFD